MSFGGITCTVCEVVLYVRAAIAQSSEGKAQQVVRSL